MKADQERVTKLLSDTVTLLCKNGLIYKNELKVQGLLGITLDRNEVFIVHIDETIGSMPDTTKSKNVIPPGTSVVDLTKTNDLPQLMPRNIASMANRRQRMSYQPHQVSQPTAMDIQRTQEMMMQMQKFARMSGNMVPQVPGMSGIFPPHIQRGRPRLANPRRGAMQNMNQPMPIADDDDVVIIGQESERQNMWGNPMRKNTRGKRQQKIQRGPITPNSVASSIGSQNKDLNFNSQLLFPGNIMGEIVIEPRDSELEKDIDNILKKDLDFGTLGDNNAPEMSSMDLEINKILSFSGSGSNGNNGGNGNGGNGCGSNDGKNMEKDSSGEEIDTIPLMEDNSQEIADLGFPTLTAVSPICFSTWQCKFPQCTSTYADANCLAIHYSTYHSKDINISPPEDVNIAALPNYESPASNGSATDTNSVNDDVSVSNNVSTSNHDINNRIILQRPKMQCPFMGCKVFFRSLKNLNSHHTKMHSVPITVQQRRFLMSRHSTNWSVVTPGTTDDYIKEEVNDVTECNFNSYTVSISEKTICDNKINDEINLEQLNDSINHTSLFKESDTGQNTDLNKIVELNNLNIDSINMNHNPCSPNSQNSDTIDTSTISKEAINDERDLESEKLNKKYVCWYKSCGIKYCERTELLSHVQNEHIDDTSEIDEKLLLMKEEIV